MEKQVNAICKSCYYQICCVSSIHPYITTEAYKTLVQVLVISRLDYVNALLYGVFRTLVSRLQRIQKSAARLVKHILNWEHTTPVLLQFWLPVKYRSWYKTVLHTFKIMSGQASLYLKDIVQKHRPLVPFQSY